MEDEEEFDKSENMKPTLAVDEMFSEGTGGYMDMDESGSSSAMMMDLATNEKHIHADFYNDFDDLFDDDEDYLFENQTN